jgi:ribosomal protein S11
LKTEIKDLLSKTLNLDLYFSVPEDKNLNKPKLLGVALDAWTFLNHPLTLHESYINKPNLVILLSNLLIYEIKALSIKNQLPFDELPDSASKQIIHEFLSFLSIHTEIETVTSLSYYVCLRNPSICDILNKTITLDFEEKPIIKQKRLYTRNLHKRAKKAALPINLKKKLKSSRESINKALKEKQIKIIRYGLVFINLKRTNIFISISTKPHKVNYIVSAGQAKFAGRHKSSSFARDSIAKLTSSKAIALNIRVIDVWFINTISQLYRPILLGLIFDFVIIRLLKIRYRRSHGYVRSGKRRRI